MDLQRILALSQAIRYVAANLRGQVSMVSRPSLADASSSESDRYEELLVNPALLNLAGNRGKIDCGGLDYLVIRYGAFFQYVQPLREGHISVAIEPSAEPLAVVVLVRAMLKKEGML